MKQNNNEVWKAVLGYEGIYEFSNKQRVRSVDRDITYKNGTKRHVKGKLLTITPTQDGYLSVNLSRDGKSKTVYIHQLLVTDLQSFTQATPEQLHTYYSNKLDWTVLNKDTQPTDVIDVDEIVAGIE